MSENDNSGSNDSSLEKSRNEKLKPQRSIRGRRLRRVLVGFCLTLALLAAGTGWWYTHRSLPPAVRQTLFEGITYVREIHRTPRPMVVHIVTLDLTAPGLSFLVTPGDPGKPRPLIARKTTQFVREFGLQIAINGDFFFPWWSHAPWDYYPHVGDPVELEGHAVSRGKLYSYGGERRKFPVLHISRTNRAWFGHTLYQADVYNALSGIYMLMENGEVIISHYPHALDLQPRTAVGLDKAGKTMFFVLVDGRQPNYSEGASLIDLADILRRAGAYEALNLDGGGSTTLVIQDKNGQPTILNCPIDNHIPGRERPVANHLGVFARRLPPAR